MVSDDSNNVGSNFDYSFVITTKSVVLCVKNKLFLTVWDDQHINTNIVVAVFLNRIIIK